jgi:hypothetical protein
MVLALSLKSTILGAPLTASASEFFLVLADHLLQLIQALIVEIGRDLQPPLGRKQNADLIAIALVVLRCNRMRGRC